MSVHYRTCHLCEAMCGLEIHTQDERVTAIRGDAQDPFSAGHLCPKATAIADIHEDPDRLRQPMRRGENGWEPISWDEALDEVVDRLAEIREAHGPDSVAVYAGNPNVHNYGMMTHASLFLKPLKTRNRFSASSVDQMPTQLVSYLMYGHQFLVPIPDLDRTEYLLILGANPLASNGSLMTAPDVKRRLKSIQERGGKLIVVDPRKTETAQLADQHVFIRPGTDAYLLAAMLGIVAETAAETHLSPLLDGLSEVLSSLGDFTPERVAPLTGIEASTIRALAHDLVQAPRAVVYGRMGTCTQEYGATCQWLIQLLNIVTGNLDREGGAMFTLPAFDLVGAPKTRQGHFGVWHSRVRQLPEFSGELPVAAMAEEMLTPGEGQIRALITAAGNPVLSTPDGSNLERALGQLDFMVSIDYYINETTRFANLILPPTSPLEHDHYDMIFHIFAVRNTTRYSEPIFPKPEGSLDDWEIYSELGRRLAKRLNIEAGQLPAPYQLVDQALQYGPYGKARGHEAALSLARLKEAPHGIDLGPLQPALPERLATEDKRIHCAPQVLIADLERLRNGLDQQPPKLALIGRRYLRGNNSWMHNFKRLTKGKPQCVLLVNPNDLKTNAVSDGDTVWLQSRVGKLKVAVSASDDMMPGVVCLPHGFGHDREGVQLQHAREVPGGSINDLTDPEFLDTCSGNAALNGLPVNLTPIS